MTFRTRLLVTFPAAVLVSMLALSLLVRSEMSRRLTSQYERRAEALLSVIEADLAQRSETIARALAIVGEDMIDDNRLRQALLEREGEERRYLLDYAGEAMQLAGLSMLQIQDGDGRILSSGHFRNEFDRAEPALPALVRTAGAAAVLVQARAPDAPFLALVRSDSVRMAGRTLTLIGGVRVERRFLDDLARDELLDITLTFPDGALSSRAPASTDSTVAEGKRARAIVRELEVPFVDTKSGRLASAQFRVRHDLAELRALQRGVDRWFVIAVAITGVVAVLFASWIAARMSRPLFDLAEKTAQIDLDRLDVDLDTGRRDEVGTLSRVLNRMTERLRVSASMIKDAERRATLGELARQVNHDIKNGLTPLRNVFRHIAQVADGEPDRLGAVFRERRGTIDSSVGYLEKLASNYARLSTRGNRKPCDVNRVVADATATARRGDVEVTTELDEGVVVVGDEIALRRIIENLVNNAVDSLEGNAGTVRVVTRATGEGDDEPRVLVVVEDNGKGMTEEEATLAFDDFYTTKESGTGLGLSIVRRLVMDLDGSIEVDSEPGRGSRFTVSLPASPAGGRRPIS